MEDVGSAAGAVAFGEPRDCTVVQELDPFDGSVDAVAVADRKIREALILFIPRGYLLPSLFLEALQPFMEVHNGVREVVLLLFVDPVVLPNGVYEQLCDTPEPDWVIGIESLNDVSSGVWRDGVNMRDGHENRGAGARGTVGGHQDVSVWGAEWKGVGRVGVRGGDVVGG